MLRLVDNLEVARDFLNVDPLRNVVPIYRLFHSTEYNEAWVDSETPSALLTLAPSRSTDEDNGVSLVAKDEDALISLIERLPRNRLWFVASDDLSMNVIRRSVDVEWMKEAWLLALNRSKFVPFPGPEVKSFGPSHAEAIAKHWSPEEDETEYVRHRIQIGPALGIFEDSELVAWGMTHQETDKAVVLGFLHVEENFRRQGYAKRITSALCEYALSKAKTPLVHIFTDNEASLRLSEVLGFRRISKTAWGYGRVR